MVSIIISSANPAQLQQVSENITATIGVPFEIIAADNSQGRQGICAVYNQGAQKAQYDVLCFMHEDVIIKTDNWGQVLTRLFADDAGLGLVGVVGGAYKPFTCSSWAGLGFPNNFMNFIQSFKYSGRESFHAYRNPHNAKLERVACADGVWLATTRKIAGEIRFDEHTFRGFHGYDLDFSIAVGQHYKVAVTFEVLLEHLSEGSYSRDWMDDNFKLHSKWKAQLPINTHNYSRTQCAYMEKVTFKDFVKKLIKLKYPANVAHEALNDKRYRELGIYWKLKYFTYRAYAFKRKYT